ncbi:hypothetical protein N7490_006622 [Penicillium lividum]|nr:hypothetical protein N7490_006622 [Penicillium lividum]
MLDRLPSEILILIAHELPAASLCALSRASSRLHSVLIPLIYRTVTFRAASEWALNVLDIESFFLHHSHPPATSYLQHTQHLDIWAPIYLARFNRCAYYSIFRTAGLSGCSSTLGSTDDATAHAQFLEDIADQLQRVVAHLKPDSLRTFQSVLAYTLLSTPRLTADRWRLGTCLPAGLLDRKGYLTQNQRRLRRLSLVTDGTCPSAQNGLEGLSDLPCLTTLEWEGLQHPMEVQSLRQCIDRNKQHLRTLSVGFVFSAVAQSLHWETLGLQGDADEPCMGDEKGSSKVVIAPHLRTLSLIKVSLPLGLMSTESSIFCSLRALTLRDCPNQLHLLRSLSRSPTPMQLNFFEACFDFLLNEPGEDGGFAIVSRFLCSFRGLEHLHLRLSNYLVTDAHIQDAIRGHLPTLKSLLYHERQLMSINDDGLFARDRDVLPGWIANLVSVVNTQQLTALALCADPYIARQYLQPMARGSRLQILHLRFSGPERMYRDMRQEISSVLRKRRVHITPMNMSIELSRLSLDAGIGYSHVLDDQNSPPSGLCDAQECDVQGAATATMVTEAEDFVSFAEWAFGSDGLPDLRVLALGDFSHGDRYRCQQFLVRRVRSAADYQRPDPPNPKCQDSSHLSFCPGEISDPEVWRGVSIDGVGFLSSCPEGGLIESPYEF